MLNEYCAGAVTSAAKDGVAPESRQDVSLREEQIQRSALCATDASKPFAGQRPALPKTCANIESDSDTQRVLCWSCDKRSQGWRSARVETGCLVEERTDSAQCGMCCVAFKKRLLCNPALRINSRPQWITAFYKVNQPFAGKGKHINNGAILKQQMKSLRRKP